MSIQFPHNLFAGKATAAHSRWAQALALAVLLVICTAAAAHCDSSLNPKKGFGVVVRQDGVWRTEVVSLRASWFYSWGPDEPDDMPARVEFVPMDWGYYGNKNGALTKWIAQVAAQPNIHTLLGFNEPDNKSQSNLTVDKAIEGWPYLQQSGLTLGSPAYVHADDAWMTRFMAEAQTLHYKVDFVTVHWYGDPDPQSFLNYLAKVHDLYKLPVWVTEFAPADWTGHHAVTAAQAMQFMRVVIPAMNKLDYIQRYAWFSGSPNDPALGDAALFHTDGSLTRLGALYASY